VTFDDQSQEYIIFQQLMGLLVSSILADLY